MNTARAASPRSAADSGPGALRVVCIATDIYASAALQATVSAILPSALVDAADTSIVRSAPDADCVILGVGSLYSLAHSLVRDLRARGYQRPILLVVTVPGSAPAHDLLRLGVDTILAESTVALKLPEAMAAALARQARCFGSAPAAAISRSLRRLRATIAAGEVATGLQHALNNPLAALLAEAQLLELESLAPEHRLSVRRMVELCRRVIRVSRSIEGIGVDPDEIAMLRDAEVTGQ